MKTKLAICKLPSDAFVPQWATSKALLAVITTPQEMTLVCDDNCIPDGITREGNWRAYFIDADLDFNLVGILASLLNPLAERDVSVFTISTYSTDYILVRGEQLEDARHALVNYGFNVIDID